MTRDNIPILRSGVLALEFCRQHARAEVATVFERSLYLRAGSAFVCLGEPSIGNGPLTLIAEFGPVRKLAALGLSPDQQAFISNHGIAIGAVQLTLDLREPWRPPPWPPALPAHGLAEACAALSHLVAAGAPSEGLGHSLSRPRIARFRSWLSDALEGDHLPPFECVHALIGLGPGLTPSGDDILVGALALLDALSERRAHAALAHAIATAPRGLTSPLSGCLLRMAAAGHIGEQLWRAVAAVVSGAPAAAVAALRGIGHSSGWDMLAGIAMALAAAAQPFQRSKLRVWNAERSSPTLAGVA
jgi:hypothetical protein